jgi:hypothetical protein
MEQLQRELSETRRELAAARRTLREQRAARGRPIGPEDTVKALRIVLQHNVPEALAKVQRDRERLAVELRVAQERLRTHKDWYTSVRFNVWQIAQSALQGIEWPVDALQDIVQAVEDSDDDVDYERRHAG